jgi:hypothetical protein
MSTPNNYIVTNFGFVKIIAIEGQGRDMKYVIQYTDKLRYALPLSAKVAKKIMERHDIIGFLYNPYAEEPVRNMYEVKKRTRFFEETEQLVYEWQACKAIMISESDANFLQSQKLQGRDLMTLGEAQAKAIELNTKMLEELQVKVQKQKELATNTDPIDVFEEYKQ